MSVCINGIILRYHGWFLDIKENNIGIRCCYVCNHLGDNIFVLVSGFNFSSSLTLCYTLFGFLLFFLIFMLFFFFGCLWWLPVLKWLVCYIVCFVLFAVSCFCLIFTSHHLHAWAANIMSFVVLLNIKVNFLTHMHKHLHICMCLPICLRNTHPLFYLMLVKCMWKIQKNLMSGTLKYI